VLIGSEKLVKEFDILDVGLTQVFHIRGFDSGRGTDGLRICILRVATSTGVVPVFALPALALKDVRFKTVLTLDGP
jgi:hypothetical protein